MLYPALELLKQLDSADTGALWQGTGRARTSSSWLWKAKAVHGKHLLTHQVRPADAALKFEVRQE